MGLFDRIKKSLFGKKDEEDENKKEEKNNNSISNMTNELGIPINVVE